MVTLVLGVPQPEPLLLQVEQAVATGQVVCQGHVRLAARRLPIQEAAVGLPLALASCPAFHEH
jgi:hypothetical protein